MHLPKGVHVKHGRYYYVISHRGKRRWIKLSRVSEGEPELFQQLAKVKRAGAFCLGDIFDLYIAEGMRDLAAGTQKGYLGYIRRSLRPVFGHLQPEAVEPGHVSQFLELRKQQGAGVVANRERACLSSVYNFAMRRGLASFNPCRGVRRNKEQPKDRYVDHNEYLASFEAAEDYTQDLMAVIYLMALRPNEARKLQKSQITDQGIRWQESKTGKIKIIAWSKALHFFINRACERTPESPYVLTNSLGRPWTEWGMHSALRRIRRRVVGDSWTWHDLRAKGESDSKEGMGLLPLYKRAHRIKPVV